MAYRNNEAVICTGNTVEVRDGKFDQALRKFKNKVRDSGLLLDLRDREAYVKPTTRRKEKMAAAKSRHKKRLSSDTLPKKLF
jgi:small subunit ribosomal protein S21